MLGFFPILYLALVIGVGLSHRRTITGESDFFLARRSGGYLLITGSLLATMFGSFGVLGMSGLGYDRGLVGGWYLWGGAVGLMVLGGWALRRMDYGDVYTLPELLGRGYGKPVRQISAALIALAWLSIIAAQLIAAGKITEFMGTTSGWWNASEGGSPWLIVMLAIVFIVYTCLGGQHSVLRTDLLQAGAIAVALMALVIGALRAEPGALSQVEGQYLEFPLSENFTAGEWLTIFLTFGVPFLVGPDIYSRLFSGRDKDTGRRAILSAAVVMIPLVFLIVLAGILGRAIVGPEADGEVVILQLSTLTISPFWTGLLVASLLAAVMSSADTCLLTISTLVSRDLLDTTFQKPQSDKRFLLRGRLIIAVAGIASLLFALQLETIVGALGYCYKVYSPAVLCPFLALVLFRRRRFGALTGVLAVALGGGCAALGIALDTQWLQLAAFGVSAVPIAIEILIKK